MADLLQDFSTYFIGLSLTTVSTCYLDIMPTGPDTCIAIYEYQGGHAVSQISGVPRSIQIVTRDESAQNARQTAQALYRALQSDTGIVYLTSQRWTVLVLRQVPWKLKVDEQGRTLYAFNVGVLTYND